MLVAMPDVATLEREVENVRREVRNLVIMGFDP